jgi:GntR family transcriptional regulator, transcriptional repressor for pyruvate dehydrogenase complex
MFRQMLQRMDEAFERPADSPFNTPGFGLSSFPPHRDLADAILAADPDAAEAAINRIIDCTEGEIRAIISGPDVA